MIGEQEGENLLGRQQQNENTQTHRFKQISKVRLSKELEFIKGYQFLTEESEDGCNIIINNLWKFDDISSISHLKEKKLTIFLPKEYPFQQPSFLLEDGQPILISQLVEEWSPKYKVMEMIQLIKVRIQQRCKIQSSLEGNLAYRIFSSFNSIWLIFLIGLLVRILVGLGSYSGKGDWPNFGDFEAHRNWMSITVSKPIDYWYHQKSEQPWWRIDYPPVAAYISYIFGTIYQHIEPQSMILQFGYQSQNLKSFMRFSVLIIDFFLLLPILYAICQLLSPSRYKNFPTHLTFIFITMFKPDQILIDHGHFQYNSLMLGLILAAFYCLLIKRNYLACFLYVLAINTKLMSVYYCLAFLAGLMGLAGKNRSLRNKKKQYFFELFAYGVIVIGTTVLLWIPWIGTVQNFKNVLSAIFPIHRGLYQLKVPNFWCISDIIMKWQTWISKPYLTILCACACFFFSLPSMLALMTRSSSHKVLIIGFSTIAMTFFMFSYHVHEKSILVPLTLIPFCAKYIGGKLIVDLTISACMGMYHLLVEDGQKMSYFIIIALYYVFASSYYQSEEEYLKIYESYKYENHNNSIQIFSDKTAPISHSIHNRIYNFQPHTRIIVSLTFILLHLGKATIPPPSSLPYLWNLLFAFHSFSLNVYFLVIANSILLEEISFALRSFKKQ